MRSINSNKVKYIVRLMSWRKMSVPALMMSANLLLADSPNVLVLSIDDLNDWVGCLDGHPQANTPNIDRLAKRGTLFANAHCQAPICTPARASMVTGLLPSTTGLYFLQPGISSSEVAKSQPLLMDAFSAAGYQTMSAGKFVQGGREEAFFDEYGGTFGGFGPNAPEKLHAEHGGPNWDWGVYPEHDDELPDSAVADWVIDRLERSHEKPFFLVAGFWRPHVPMYVPQKWHDLFPEDSIQLPQIQLDDRHDLPEYAKDLTNGEPAPRHEWFVDKNKWRSAIRSYLASVAFVDSCVGRVLDALDKSAHRDNTIVVLLSDHGWHLGEKERWAKRSLWVDGTRIPLIIVAPGYGGEQVTHSPAGLIDLYPTLLELTGVTTEARLEGYSLVSQMKDPKSVRPQPTICTFGPNNHSLFYSKWHYIRYADSSEELYDLETDIHEWNNLAGDSEYSDLIRGFQKDLPTFNAIAIRREGWDRWEISDWENAERNARLRNESNE